MNVMIERLRHGLVVVLGARMHQNLPKGPRSVSITAYRVINVLLRVLVPKRDGNHKIERGQVSFGS